ncbi:MAG: TolC family protein [Acidobacteria bacterium]|nr:TolC family protein [Acidobacteriota bacterium]
MISNGLDLVRDTRIAYWEAVMAERRALLAEESSQLRGQIAELVLLRLRAGDLSELESLAAHTERDVAQEQAGRSKKESAIAKEWLRSLLGLGPESSGVTLGVASGFEIAPVERDVPALPEVNAVVAQALASRPDLRAIELGLEAARERAGLDRWSYLNATVVVDANAKGTEGFEAGPGLQGSIPIFDRNQGLLQRADAAVEKATKDQLALKHRIELEVTESYARVIQAS